MTKTKPTVTTIPSYLVDGKLVQFWPVTNVPGFTHRVVIDRESVGFLSNDYRPSGKVAIFFTEQGTK